MDPKIKSYIQSQPIDWQPILSEIHEIILEKDKSVISEISPMMGKDMMMYKCKGMMKYALAGVKKHMSFHVLPIYVSKPLFNKYKPLFDKAIFQKGCINFSTSDQMPLELVQQFILDCAEIDLVKMREDQLKAKKMKSKAKT